MSELFSKFKSKGNNLASRKVCIPAEHSDSEQNSDTKDNAYICFINV